MDALGAHLRHAVRHAGPPAQRRLEPEGRAEPHRGRYLPSEHLRLRRHHVQGPIHRPRDGRGHHAVCRCQRRQRKAGHGGRLPVGQVRAGRPQARPGGGHEFHPHRRAHRWLHVRGGLELRDPQHLHLGRQCACTHLLQDRRLAHADHAADRPVRLGTLARDRSAVGAHRPAPDRLAPPLRHLWHHRRLRGPLGHPGREPQGHALHRRGVRHHTHAVGLCQLRAHLQPAELQGPQQHPAVARHRQQCRGWAESRAVRAPHPGALCGVPDQAGQLRRARRCDHHTAARRHTALCGREWHQIHRLRAGVCGHGHQAVARECGPDPRQGHARAHRPDLRQHARLPAAAGHGLPALRRARAAVSGRQPHLAKLH